MSRIVRPETDFGPIFRKINDRLDKLERHNAIDNASAAGLPLADSTGLLVMKSGGFTAGPGATYSTASSSTYADISGSAFTLTVPQPQRLIYFVFATTHMTAGTGHGYVRGTIVGFDSTASIWTQNTGATVITQNGMVWYFTGEGASFLTIPNGTYTVKLQASTDSTGSTLAVDQFFHQIFLLGA